MTTKIMINDIINNLKNIDINSFISNIKSFLIFLMIFIFFIELINIKFRNKEKSILPGAYLILATNSSFYIPIVSMIIELSCLILWLLLFYRKIDKVYKLKETKRKFQLDYNIKISIYLYIIPIFIFIISIFIGYIALYKFNKAIYLILPIVILIFYAIIFSLIFYLIVNLIIFLINMLIDLIKFLINKNKFQVKFFNIYPFWIILPIYIIIIMI